MRVTIRRGKPLILLVPALLVLLLFGIFTFGQRPSLKSPSRAGPSSNKTAGLIRAAKKAMAKGDYAQAKKVLALLRQTDPNDSRLSALAAELAKTTTSQTGAGNDADFANSGGISEAPTGDADRDATDSPEPTENVREPSEPAADATPLSVLPATVEGYEVTNDWLEEPTLAGGTYVPASAGTPPGVARIFVTVAMVDDAEEATARLTEEKNKFPDEQSQVEVNGVAAYSGAYGGVLTLAWTEDDWFFSVQVLPSDNSTTDLLKDAAVEVAEQLKM